MICPAAKAFRLLPARDLVQRHTRGLCRPPAPIIIALVWWVRRGVHSSLRGVEPPNPLDARRLFYAGSMGNRRVALCVAHRDGFPPNARHTSR